MAATPPQPSPWTTRDHTPPQASWSSPNASWQSTEPSVEHARFLPDQAAEPSWYAENTAPVVALPSWSTAAPQPVDQHQSWSGVQHSGWPTTEQEQPLPPAADPPSWSGGRHSWPTTEPEQSWSTAPEPSWPVGDQQPTWSAPEQPPSRPAATQQSSWSAVDEQQSSWSTDATSTFGLPGLPTAGAQPAAAYPALDATVVNGYPPISVQPDDSTAAQPAFSAPAPVPYVTGPPPYMVNTQAPHPAVRQGGNKYSRATFSLAFLALFPPFTLFAGTAAIICAVVAGRRGERRAKLALTLALIGTALGIAFGVLRLIMMPL